MEEEMSLVDITSNQCRNEPQPAKLKVNATENRPTQVLYYIGDKINAAYGWSDQMRSVRKPASYVNRGSSPAAWYFSK